MTALVHSASPANTIEITISKDGKNGLEALPAALVRGAEEAYAVNKLGLDALDKGNLDSAMACFSKASSMLPIYSEAENNKAVVHFRLGNIPIAKMIWESVVAKDPECAIALYNLGVVDFYNNDFTSAQGYFKKAIGLNKKFTEALIMMGRSLLQTDKKREACDYFKEALKIDKNRPDAWQYCAFGYMSAGDTAAAQTLLMKYKPNPEALKLLGQIEAARNNFAAASTYLAQAVSGGAMPELLTDLAAMQLEARKYKDALAAIRIYEKKVPVMTGDAYCIAGIAAKEMGDLDAARAYFEKGVKHYPQEPILRYNLGQMYFLQKKFNQAEQTWKALSDTMQDPSLYYMKALSAKQRGALDEARFCVEQALKIDEKAEYLDFLGVVEYAQGKKDEALVCFKKALKADPELRSAQLNLSLLTQSKDGLESAALELEKQRGQCKSQCQDITLQESIVLYHQGKIEKAAALLEALPEEQKDLKIVRHCALYFRQLRDWEKAIGVLETGKKRFVFDAKMDYELAEDYLLAGHYAKAIEAFKTVLSAWEENPWRIYYQLGYAFMEQNDLQKAKTNFELSLKSKPDNVATQGMLAFVYHLEGNSKQAQGMWEKNLRDDPTNPMLHINLGLSMEKDGRYGEALDHYNKAYALKPDDNALMINIGNVYEAMNKNAEALHAYSQALNSRKKDLAGYDLFLLSQKSGNETKAKEMLQVLLKEFPASVYTKRAQAEMCFKQGDTARGLSIVESIPEKDPVDWYTMARIYTGRADEKKSEQCLAMLPKEPLWEKAKVEIAVQKAFVVKDFNRAYSLLTGLHDTAFSVQYNCALAALQAKKYQEAIALGESLVQKAKGKDRGDVCRIVGNANFGLKQWKNARQWYEQLAGMERNDAVVQYNCAVASYNLGDVDAAWEYYRKARELDSTLSNKDIEKRYAAKHAPAQPDSVVVDSLDALYNSAVALQRDDKNDSAAELIYKKILDKKKEYYRAWNNLGAIYSARGDLGEALQCFLRSIEKQHDIPEAYANLVNVYIAMDSLPAAQRWTIKGIGHNPDSDVLKGLDTTVKEMIKGKKKKKS
jgi:tetratricopeptide (TPR) repeat protein